MVQASEEARPPKGENDQLDEAEEAKEKADPAVDDPAYMPNIIPQTGESDEEEQK